MGCSQQQPGVSPKAGQGGSRPWNQMGPGARHHNTLEALLPLLLLWQERQQWLGQEETLLGHHLASSQLSTGASTSSATGQEEPDLKFGATPTNY